MGNKKLEDLVFLTQTDTTIGFVSQNRQKLDVIKKRPAHKYYIKAVDSLSTLKRLGRVPTKHKNRIRRAIKSTFILPSGYSYRVIKDMHHLELITKLKWAYTTSANLSGEGYDEKWARNIADNTIEPLGQNDNAPSEIYIINNKTIKKLR